MAGRVHDYPEQLAAGLKARAVSEKYYYVRHPDINRVVDISGTFEKKTDANLCNIAKGLAATTDRSFARTSPSRARNFQFWGPATTVPRIAITSRNSSWPAIGNSAGNTAWNTRSLPLHRSAKIASR